MSKKAPKKPEEKAKDLKPKDVQSKNKDLKKTVESENLKEKELPKDFDFDLDDIEIIESKVFA